MKLYIVTDEDSKKTISFNYVYVIKIINSNFAKKLLKSYKNKTARLVVS